MTRAEIADELITMLAAGHETTATTLAWAVERLQRHPKLLDRLIADLDNGSEGLLHATILEVQRNRPVIDVTFRQVKASALRIGPWTLPRGQTIVASIGLPYGGGIRRCIGAAFATMEMRVVLRTLLRDYVINPTSARDERWQSRGVAIAPSRGARVRIQPRQGS
jgi:cytochrome P450 family 138